DNQSNTYTSINEGQPDFINDVLAIDGVKSIFHVMDFLAVDKKPKFDWEEVLPKVTATLNDEETTSAEQLPDEHYGERKAEVTTSSEEKRKQLPEIYVDSMLAAQKDNDNVVFQRKWEDLGIRYGEMDEVLEDVLEEVTAMYPKEQLKQRVDEALATDIIIPETKYKHVSLEDYQATENWKERLRMLKSFPTPTIEDLPLLGDVVSEAQKTPLRREAVILLGMIE